MPQIYLIFIICVLLSIAGKDEISFITFFVKVESIKILKHFNVITKKSEWKLKF